jgi:hypothetical protein
MGVKLFHAYGRTNGMDMTKLIVALSSFVKTPKNSVFLTLINALKV